MAWGLRQGVALRRGPGHFCGLWALAAWYWSGNRVFVVRVFDDKPVKLTIEFPPTVHRDLVAYAEILARETGHPVSDPAKLIVPMVERFMATDLAKARRPRQSPAGKEG